jgi:large subunit ribosomal protein L35
MILRSLLFKKLYNNNKFMPKLKTRKAASKRYKITSTKNFLRRHAFKGHLLMKKSNKQKRKLSKVLCVKKSDINAIKLMLPY